MTIDARRALRVAGYVAADVLRLVTPMILAVCIIAAAILLEENR